MNNSVNEIDFTSLKNNFDSICNKVNNNGEAVTLSLKGNRKVFIIPEENYNNISSFVITNLCSESDQSSIKCITRI